MSVNIPLLRKAVEWAEAEAAKPDQTQCEWYQRQWVIPAADIGRACGTCYCIAGYVALVSGIEVDCMAEENAAALLGINPRLHNSFEGLFAVDNTIEDVRRIADEIAAGAGERL